MKIASIGLEGLRGAYVVCTYPIYSPDISCGDLFGAIIPFCSRSCSLLRARPLAAWASHETKSTDVVNRSAAQWRL